MSDKVKQLGIDLICENCLFSISQQVAPPNIGRALICKRMPPPVLLVPTGSRTANAQTFPRAVLPNDFCFEYRPHPEKITQPGDASAPN